MTQPIVQSSEPPAHAEPCLLVIFGAAGDLTRRLLMPSLYHLGCDGLLPERFAVIGVALDDYDDAALRDRLSEGVKTFTTRQPFDDEAWDAIGDRIHYVQGRFEDHATYAALAERIEAVGQAAGTGGNVLFYLATPPVVFGMIGQGLARAGLHREADGAWRRLVVEKPFGSDLASARALNAELLESWDERQIFRIDHYLGKETVQNLLAFRFSNGMFEPLWNKHHIDHIQFTVSESVGVEGRGGYYEKAGVLKDMVQNHMFQMLATLCMEPPSSFLADAIRDEKAKALEAVHVMTPTEVATHAIRGQYDAGTKADGRPAVAYRDEPGVAEDSNTETFAAIKLHIDNWRWEGVPIYLRSGKCLWKRGTEILVQFKKAPEVLFKHSRDIRRIESNQLIFHIQPDQSIELRFSAKTPGTVMSLQKVDMRFDYDNAFENSRGTGYEVLLFHAMRGDATLFTRNDLVEAAWRIAQPILDAWTSEPADDFPNYEAGSWGPKRAYEIIEEDGRRWLEVINREFLARVPLFKDTSELFLHKLALVLLPEVYNEGEHIVIEGERGQEMYFISRGEVEIIQRGERLTTLGQGNFFGEKSLLLAEPRSASVRALSQVDVYVLGKASLLKVLREHPRFCRSMLSAFQDRYQCELKAADAFDELLGSFVEVPA